MKFIGFYRAWHEFFQKKRKKIYKKALNFSQEEMLFLSRARLNFFQVMRQKVVGYVVQIIGVEFFYQVRLNPWK